MFYYLVILAYLMLIVLYFLYKTYTSVLFFYLNFLVLIRMNLNYYFFIEQHIVKPKLQFYKKYFFKKFYYKNRINHLSKESNKNMVLNKINHLSSMFKINNKDLEFKYFINKIQMIEFDKTNSKFIDEIRKMEIDIVKLTNNYLHLDNYFSTLTFSDDESIILLYRSLSNLKNTNSEIMIGSNVNPKYFLLIKMFNFKIIKIKIDINGKLDLDDIIKNTSNNTIAYIISSPSYTHGILEDIASISLLAKKNKIHLHLDIGESGILHSYFSEIHLMDYEISSIISNYNYSLSPKNYSIIMYKNLSDLHNQYLINTENYINIRATLLGNESKLNIYVLWSTLLYFGTAYYLKLAKKMTFLTIYVKKKINKIEGFLVYDLCKSGIISFKSKKSLTYLKMELNKIGWIVEDFKMNELKFKILPNYDTIILDKFVKDLESLKKKKENSIINDKYDDILYEISKIYLDNYYSNSQK